MWRRTARTSARRAGAEDGLLRTNRIEDGSNVLHLGFKRRPGPRYCRSSGASLVKENQPRERREPRREVAEQREEVPGEDHADHEGNEYEISRTVADDVVGKRGIPALRVANIRRVHIGSLSLGRRFGKCIAALPNRGWPPVTRPPTEAQGPRRCRRALSELIDEDRGLPSVGPTVRDRRNQPGSHSDLSTRLGNVASLHDHRHDRSSLEGTAAKPRDPRRSCPWTRRAQPAARAGRMPGAVR